jgi:uncharacterized protein
LLGRNSVSPEELTAFGCRLAQIHAGLPLADSASRYGTFEFVRRSVLNNITECRAATAGARIGEDVESLRADMANGVTALEWHIRGRSQSAIRECHGDLHCRNVVRHDGRLVAFDCMEFEPAFRWIDVAEEIAFLWMDLRRRGGREHAARFLNAWLETSGDYEACRLLRLYGAHRAVVRAKVAALEAASAGDSGARSQASADHAEYVRLAHSLLDLERPVLILMSGFSGSGKTWLAERLAGLLGAIHLRSDIERKRLSGLAASATSGSALGEGLYTAGVNSQTYGRLLSCATTVLASELSAIVDATFQRKADRADFVRLAHDCGLRVVLIRCLAPDAVLERRIQQRSQRAKDASEGTLDVLKSQRSSYEPIGGEEQLPVIDADTTRSSVVSEVVASLTELLPTP